MLSSQMGNSSLSPFQFNILPLLPFWGGANWLSSHSGIIKPRSQPPVESNREVHWHILISSQYFCSSLSLLYCLKEWIVLGDRKCVRFFLLASLDFSPSSLLGALEMSSQGYIPCPLCPSRASQLEELARDQRTRLEVFIPPSLSLLDLSQ